MTEAARFFADSILIGAGATAFMDVSLLARKWLFGIPLLDYGLVGRWLGHMTRGRLVHDPISGSQAIPGERLIGWIAHYVTGILFASALLLVWGAGWVREPTLPPALFVGLSTVAAPFLIMQPAMGAGLAASRTPNPTASRLHSLVAHGVFGIGLYVAGTLISLTGL